MTGLAGTHAFAVPDEPAARGLVDDLVEYGFALVTAGPDTGSWVVIAFDEGPYPGDDRGRQQFAAVGRRAYALAYWHGGRTIAGFFGAPEGLPDPVGPVVVRTPGARPFVPCVGLRGAPPDAELPFWDDPKYDEDPSDIDLADLESGHRVRRVFGSSGMLGERFQRFSDASLDWTLAAKKALDSLFHNGQCVAETATAVRVAAERPRRGDVPGGRHRTARPPPPLDAGTAEDAVRPGAAGGAPGPARASGWPKPCCGVTTTSRWPARRTSRPGGTRPGPPGSSGRTCRPSSGPGTSSPIS